MSEDVAVQDLDIVTWLRGCLDEDERAARMAADLGGQWAVGLGGRWRGKGRGVIDPYGNLEDQYVRHIVLHDPARVLADVAAKRALLDAIAAWRHAVVDEDCYYTCWAATEDRDGGESCDDDRSPGRCTCGLDARRMQIYRTLATPFAGRDGYDPSWAPEGTT